MISRNTMKGLGTARNNRANTLAGSCSRQAYIARFPCMSHFRPGLGLICRGILIPGIMLSVIACSAAKAAGEPSESRTPVLYSCSDGTIVSVREYHTPGIALETDGFSGVLEHVRSASGSRYSDGAVEWWEKGGTGFLRKNGQIIKRDCRTSRLRK